MGNNISHSVSSDILSRSTQQLNQAMERLASGKRINTSKDDAVGNAIAARISATINGFDSAIKNVNDGISFAQVGDSALGGVQSSLQRIRELSVQAGNGILQDKDRTSIHAEISTLQDQITSVFEQTSFNGKKLLNTNENIEFQVGADSGQTISAAMSDLKFAFTAEGFDNLSLSTAASASDSLATIDSVMDIISAARTNFGSVQNRFLTTHSSLQQNKLSAESTRSRIVDADIAVESSKMANAQIKQQAGIAILAQANANKSSILQLLK